MLISQQNYLFFLLVFLLFNHKYLFCFFQEFVAVRVQDPRIQNEGNWNSYVDYKIFLHVSVNIKGTKC